MNETLARAPSDRWPDNSKGLSGHQVPVWAFGHYSAKQQSNFFKPLIQHYKRLYLIYRLMCAVLDSRIKKKSLMTDAYGHKRFTEQLIAALMMAELLEYLYRYYLPNPQQIKRLQKDRRVYQRLLSTRTVCLFSTKKRPIATIAIISHQIKKSISPLLWPRLLVVRIRHLLITTLPFAKSLKNMVHTVEHIDKYAHPVLMSLGWFLHASRLLLNMLTLLQHTIAGDWMSAHEKELGFFFRLQGQVQQHWMELVNDTMPLLSIVIPVTIVFSIAIGFFEVFSAGLQTLLEIRRLMNLHRELAKAMPADASLEEIKADLVTGQNYLTLCMMHEQKKCLLRVINILSIMALTVLKASLLVFMPTLALNPILPLVIALALLVFTVVCHVLNKGLERQKPAEKITLASDHAPSIYATRLTFFTPARDVSLSPSKPDPCCLITNIHHACQEQII